MRSRKELPEQVEPENPEITHAVIITYYRSLGWVKVSNGKESAKLKQLTGGALATYPKELDFKLDVSNLLPEIS